MESLVTELVWLVTNYQAWVVGVLLFGDPHVWYRRYSFFEILALCKNAGTWAGHGPVSWTGRASARPSLPTGPDLEVYQNRGVCLAKSKLTPAQWEHTRASCLAKCDI